MTERESDGLYAAFKAKDARFDGRFFVGISSTGVYCRPVCRAKQPKAENCTFYATAAEAEQAGYRPCLLCRPELAPGTAAVDAAVSLAKRAAVLLEESCGSGQGVEELAGRLGCTSRHLRRVFVAEYNVTPVQYLQTCRLLLAKNLLTDTGLSVLEVAMASGFGSLRRFNDLFKKQYRLPPTTLRRQAADGKQRKDGVVLSLGYRPPYRWDQMVDFLTARAIPGVEAVRGGKYLRTVRFAAEGKKELYGWICVGNKPKKNVMEVTVSASLLPVLPQVLARVRHLFDLYCDPEAVFEALSSINDIRPGLYGRGMRVPGCFDPFEMVVRAVLGQQVTVKAAGTLAARLVQAYGAPVETGLEGLTHTFPRPEDILALDDRVEDDLGPLGITAARSKTILELARVFAQGGIEFGPGARPEAEMKKLKEIPGIGNWTAQYIAMRAMGWPDAFLETDAGIKKALAPHSPGEMLRLADTWRPWRSYATIGLWNSLKNEGEK